MVSSIDHYADGFLSQWGVNVHKFMSLPGIAEFLAYKYYNENAAPIYSFGQKFSKYNKEIREDGLIGGICVVFCRMLVAGIAPAVHKNFPQAAFQGKNGELYRSIRCFDVNSLYPFVFQGVLPTGPGIAYEKRGSSFYMTSMHQSGKRSSMECITWLEVNKIVV